MLMMRVYFPYKAVLPKNLARVFRFSSIKKRFRIIWESESNRNTRMNIPSHVPPGLYFHLKKSTLNVQLHTKALNCGMRILQT